MDKEIRAFPSGSTRDTAEGKLSYVKALSPIVLQRYAQYLDAHRKQSDGSMREFDNWKNGIPEDIYLDGLGRHFIAAWLLAQGYPASDNHGSVTLEDTLCAIIFGASGWLHELLKKETITEFVCPEEWVIELDEATRSRYYRAGGWSVCKKEDECQCLRKDGRVCRGTGWNDNHKYGEAPGYWPTKQEAEAALAAYLEKQ